MNFDLQQLNEEQLKAVMDTEGAVMVTAGAGSGKTRLLTHRIAHLITDINVLPYRILAITFTNKAAREMKERLTQMVERADDIWISTFHALCVRILRKFITKLGYNSNYSIYAEDEKEKIVKKLIKKYPVIENDDMCKKVMWSISNAKNSGATPDEYCVKHKFEENIDYICKIYAEYEAELRKNNALDFDDLLTKAYELLKNDAEAREFYQEKFLYIHVDEFQDTNSIQYSLVKILGAKHQNIFVVGDEDQCIYGWRGANIQNIYDFKDDFHCKFYKLEQNYRSTKQILGLANKLIGNNTSRIDKKLWTVNEDGDEVVPFTANSETEEADMVASKIVRLMREYDYKFSDFAILMRLNALTRSFEEKLIQYGIPHKVFGGYKFFERKEIKDLMAYLKILVNPLDNEAIIRVINFPKRGIGETTVMQLNNYAEIKQKSLFDVICTIGQNEDLPLAMIKKVEPFANLIASLLPLKDKLTPSELVVCLVESLHLSEVFAENTEENENRMMHVDEFINSVRQYTEANPGITLDDYMQMIVLYSELDEMSEGNNCVNLATVHSAKGLEFKVVFLVGLEENIFPLRRAAESPSELEEERRLMYVAITRAREKLYMSRAKMRFLYGTLNYTLPSRFLKELDFETAKPIFTSEARKFMVQHSLQQPATPLKPIVVPTAQKNDSTDLTKFQLGSKVRHRKFGEGIILNITNEHNGCYAEIEFPNIGKITLALAYAPLTPVD